MTTTTTTTTPLGPNEPTHDASGAARRCSCGCCEGTSVETPVEVSNRPGLSAIAYRVGTHARFKRSMLAKLSDHQRPALLNLKTRDDDDFSVALIDAWAVVADVLTFYQERIANESYLRTATERRSVAEMVRAIGYELAPGVAANAYLAFTLEDAPGAPGEALIAPGTKVKSVPGQDEKPQTFETIEEVETRAAWNKILPRLTEPQPITPTMERIIFEGVATNLQTGDRLLIVIGSKPEEMALRVVKSVEVDNDRSETVVALKSSSGGAGGTTRTPDNLPPGTGTITAKASPADTDSDNGGDDDGDSNFIAVSAPALTLQLALNETTVAAIFGGRVVPGAEFIATSLKVGWSVRAVAQTFIAKITRETEEARAADLASSDTGVFAMRARHAHFGYNAPDWNAMSGDVRGFYEAMRLSSDLIKSDWPSSATIAPPGQIDLDAVNNKILPGSWAVVRRPAYTIPPVILRGVVIVPAQDVPALENVIARISSATETAAALYTLTGKSTRLALDAAADVSPGNIIEIRTTTVYCQSEELVPAELPITAPVAGKTILLGTLYGELAAGRNIAVTGEDADLEGVVASEIAQIAEVSHDFTEGRTTITLAADLTHRYRRTTAVINANVVLSTHGETVSEVLGSGNAAQPYQRFTLRQSPLTHTTADTPSGGASTLEVRVNDLLWTEVETLYGRAPRDRVYVTRIDDDASTRVQFGDGLTGARLPTGQENVIALYRKGIGEEGEVDKGQLSLLMTRPLGVKGVTNPVAASGGADPQEMADAQENAPVTVLTLDRIVSLLDYRDFARGFAGISKAHATWTFNVHARGVFVTVAGDDGDPVDGILHDKLVAAMRKAGDANIPIVVATYRPAYFKINATLKVDAAYVAEKVLAAVEAALTAAFSFAARSFGQAVALSEVVAVMQNVEGVVSVDVNHLRRSVPRAGELTLNAILLADAPQPGTKASQARAAEMLLIDPDGVELEAEL